MHKNPFDSGVFGSGQPAQFRRLRRAFVFLVRPVAGAFRRVALVFVGDGLSDRFAAQVAHVTFAKNKLLKFCREKEIKHLPYADFREIEAWLAKEMKGSHACVS